MLSLTRTLTQLCLILLLAGAIQSVTLAAGAQDKPAAGTQACLVAYEKVQDLRAEGKLQMAKKQAISCSRATCPDAIAKDCRQWLDQINLSLPSVVFDVKSEEGTFLAEAKVYVDDELIAEKLDGRAITIDPGAHRVRAELGDYETAELQVMVQEGQRNRTIEIVLKTPGTDAPTTAGDQQDEVPVATWIFGGMAVAGLVVGGVFLGLGLDKRSQLEDCRPSCAGEDVDDMMTKLVVGDVALGASVVAAAAALTIYLTRPDAASANGRLAPRFGLSLTPGGAAGVLQTTF